MSSIIEHVVAELRVEEAVRQFLYDDATGKQFVKGMTLVGNLTGGIGINLSAGFDGDEINWLCAHRTQKVIDALEAYSWYLTQDDVRKAALVDMGFNLGVDKLLHFPHFLAAMDQHAYPQAVGCLHGSLWESQVKARAIRLENMILTGEWPKDISV